MSHRMRKIISIKLFSQWFFDNEIIINDNKFFSNICILEREREREKESACAHTRIHLRYLRYFIYYYNCIDIIYCVAL